MLRKGIKPRNIKEVSIFGGRAGESCFVPVACSQAKLRKIEWIFPLEKGLTFGVCMVFFVMPRLVIATQKICVSGNGSRSLPTRNGNNTLNASFDTFRADTVEIVELNAL